MKLGELIRSAIKNGLLSALLLILFWCPTATETHHSDLVAENEEIGHISYRRGWKGGDYIDINSTKIHCNIGLASRRCPYTRLHFKPGVSEKIYKASFIEYKSFLRDELILIELSLDGIPLYGYSKSDLEYFRNKQQSNSNSFAILFYVFAISLLTFFDWKKQKAPP